MKQLIVLGGPTASGKTALAIQWALELNCPIVSADSRQVYKEMSIGVARPSPSELESVPHYFIASHSIHNPLNAGIYEREALALLNELFKTNNYIVLCGGTGLYIKALIHGLDSMPPAQPILRQTLQTLFDNNGIEALQQILMQKDPAFYPIAEIHNPQRLIRAIEIVSFENRSNLFYQKKKNTQRPFVNTCFMLNPPVEEVSNKIHKRVDQMIEMGLEEEVKHLLPFRTLTPLQTVGYSEFFEYFDGDISKKDCIEKIKTNTRRYAKRQRTWFRHQLECLEITAENGASIRTLLTQI